MEPEWIALWVSVLSIALAALALGWNIYRDVVLKARLRVRFAVVDVIVPGIGKTGTYLNVTGTNFGPGILTVNMVWGRSTRWWQRLAGNRMKWVVPNQTAELPGSKLPVRIEIGQKVETYSPYSQDCMLKEHITAIGLTDSFGRQHRAPRKDILKVLERYERDFG